MIDANSLKNEFIAEASENLENIEVKLLNLEKDQHNTEIIADVFRAIHSIKGAAGFLGFPAITKLSHVMETILQMIRSKEVLAETPHIDALLTGVDMLRSLLNDLESSQDVDIQPLLHRFEALIHKSAPDTAAKIQETVSLADINGKPSGFAINRFQLNHLPHNCRQFYMLRFDLNELQVRAQLSPVQLIRNLMRSGWILDTRVESQAANLDADLSAMPLLYLVLFATSMAAEQLEEVASLSGDHIMQLQFETQITTEAKPAAANQLKPEAGAKPEPLSAPGEADPHEAARKESLEHGETIRIHIGILDRLMDLAGELVLVRNQQLLSMEKSIPISRAISQRLNIVTSELQETIMRTRMQPMRNIFARLPRIVRDLCEKLNKRIELKLQGDDVELDKTILEALSAPLTHIIRNACDHGIENVSVRLAAGKPETGKICVKAYHEAGQINLRVEDDGKGIDPAQIKAKALAHKLRSEEAVRRMTQKELFDLLLLPGFTTSNELSDVSGRGVGLDVVNNALEQLGGSLEIQSEPGRGAVFHLRMPLTLAIIPCLIVWVGDYRYAIPQVNLVELVCLYDEDVYQKIEIAEDQEVYRLRERLLPIARLNKVFEHQTPFTRSARAQIANERARLRSTQPMIEDFSSTSLQFAVVKFGERRYGLVVDKVIGTEEIVVQPMHSAVKNLGVYSGATVLGDGEVALILDVEGVARHADVPFITLAETDNIIAAETDMQTVLLFKSGASEQFAVSLPLIRRIERISAANIERIGQKEFITLDGVSIFIIRIDECLTVSKYAEQDEPFLLLPKHIKRPFGILLSSVIDIAESPLSLNVNSYMEDGLLGTALIKDRMTLFIDIYRLIELSEPDWFAERRTANPPPTAKKRILLAEDSPFFRQLVKKYLESDHYEVIAVENGQRALEVMNQQQFDLIVSDLDMPVLNGWRFIEAVRQHHAHIPAVALTALDSDQDRQAAAAAGFNAYEIKIDREQLLTTIAHLIRCISK